MKTNKSPSLYGFTAGFCRVFWVDIQTFLVRSVSYGFDHKMFVIQRQVVITLSQREGKSKYLLKNWRLITLLNTA